RTPKKPDRQGKGRWIMLPFYKPPSMHQPNTVAQFYFGLSPPSIFCYALTMQALSKTRFLLVLLTSCCFLKAHAARIVLVAGGGEAVEARATETKLSAPFGTAFDARGNMFLVEMTGHLIRKVDPVGMLTTYAGTGIKGDAGDGGPALKA